MAQQLEDDTQGNILGERGTFVYTANNGTVYNMIQDVSVAAGVGSVASSDPNAPKITAAERIGLKARYINVEDVATGLKKKRILIGNATGAFMTGANTTPTINGTEYRVTTIVGERRTVPRVTAPIIP